MTFTRECFQASRWTKNNRLFPGVLEVSPVGVTLFKRSMFGSEETHISITKIASVHIASGPIFAAILIDSTGGMDPLRSNGHSKADALRIQELIEFAQAQLARSSVEREEDLAEHKPCLFCAENIKAAAIVCRFCGRDQSE